MKHERLKVPINCVLRKHVFAGGTPTSQRCQVGQVIHFCNVLTLSSLSTRSNTIGSPGVSSLSQRLRSAHHTLVFVQTHLLPIAAASSPPPYSSGRGSPQPSGKGAFGARARSSSCCLLPGLRLYLLPRCSEEAEAARLPVAALMSPPGLPGRVLDAGVVLFCGICFRCFGAKPLVFVTRKRVFGGHCKAGVMGVLLGGGVLLARFAKQHLSRRFQVGGGNRRK